MQWLQKMARPLAAPVAAPVVNPATVIVPAAVVVPAVVVPAAVPVPAAVVVPSKPGAVEKKSIKVPVKPAPKPAEAVPTAAAPAPVSTKPLHRPASKILRSPLRPKNTPADAPAVRSTKAGPTAAILTTSTRPPKRALSPVSEEEGDAEIAVKRARRGLPVLKCAVARRSPSPSHNAKTAALPTKKPARLPQSNSKAAIAAQSSAKVKGEEAGNPTKMTAITARAASTATKIPVPSTKLRTAIADPHAATVAAPKSGTAVDAPAPLVTARRGTLNKAVLPTSRDAGADERWIRMLVCQGKMPREFATEVVKAVRYRYRSDSEGVRLQLMAICAAVRTEPRFMCFTARRLAGADRGILKAGL